MKYIKELSKVIVCMCVCMNIHMHVEARGERQHCSLDAVHLVF